LQNQHQDEFKIEEFTNFLRAQKGFNQWNGLTFPKTVLKFDEKKRDTFIKTQTQNHIATEYEVLIKKHQPLFISEEQLEKFLDIATEDEFTNILLIPLLRHIGFITAEAKGHRDKSLEFGQDIQRMKLQIPTKHWLYFSGQVKRGDIRANTKKQKENVEAVLTQTQMQLEWAMPDTETNQNVKPDHILLIVSGNITEAAKQYIFNHTLYKRKRVLLWEREKIITLCKDKGLPETVQKIILEYNQKNG
jgi:hypothetical protein